MSSDGSGASALFVAGRERWPMVVITAIDRVFGGGARLLRQAEPALAALRARNIPVVCVSDRNAKAVASVQRSIGVEAPFVCHHGRELHIPHGYFWSVPPASDHPQPSDIIRTDGSGNAVAIVTSLYRARQSDVMIVGTIGSTAERELLRHVDVPILIRPDHLQDPRLDAALPGAYVTHWNGAAGWSEAILGWPG
jgi:hypothetical protein